MKRLVVPIVTAIAAALLAISPAATAEKAADTDTFDGQCEFSGMLQAKPALRVVPAPGKAAIKALGSCTGTFTDDEGNAHQLDGDTVRYVAKTAGFLSCGGGTAAGSGYLLYGDEKLNFGFDEVRGPALSAVRLGGHDGGSAMGSGAVSTEEDPLEVIQKCETTGLDEVEISISIVTSPTISG